MECICICMSSPTHSWSLVLGSNESKNIATTFCFVTVSFVSFTAAIATTVLFVFIGNVEGTHHHKERFGRKNKINGRIDWTKMLQPFQVFCQFTRSFSSRPSIFAFFYATFVVTVLHHCCLPCHVQCAICTIKLNETTFTTIECVESCVCVSPWWIDENSISFMVNERVCECNRHPDAFHLDRNRLLAPHIHTHLPFECLMLIGEQFSGQFFRHRR